MGQCFQQGVLMSPVQQVIPQVHSLPIWLEYVRVLGTPVAAIFGAAIAGLIAYRQMLTARNKLKLELFDKRISVYTAAVDLLSTINNLDQISVERFDEIIVSLNGAVWLLDRNADTYLQDLRLEVRELRDKSRLAVKGDEKILAMRENKDFRERHSKKLREVFEPFLQLGH
jgi:hypothetical protein